MRFARPHAVEKREMGSEGSYVHKGFVTPLFLYLCYSAGEVNPMSVLSWDPLLYLVLALPDG